MPEHFALIGEAIGSATWHNARMAADLAAAQRLAEQPVPAQAVPAGGHPAEAQQDSAPDADTPDVTSHLYRDALLVLLSRLVRGVLLPEERTLLREHVEHLLAAVDRSDEAARRALEQRQDLAAERYAWQERGRKAEAALTRLDQMATAWLEQLPDTIRTATAAEAVQTTVRAVLVGACDQHPDAPVIGGMCGGCTAYPDDMR